MSPEQTEQQALYISQEKLLAFVRVMIGGSRGREGDEHPLPPGPWDPVIRVAVERINFRPPPLPWWEQINERPHPEPWRIIEPGSRPWPQPWNVVVTSILARHPEIWDVIGSDYSLGEEVTLNPQLLPPRFAFLVAVAQTVISRAELLQEIADALGRVGESQGIIIVAGYTGRFSDDFCGTGLRLKWPFPGPPPPWWITDELNGMDLLVLATQFEQAAEEAFSQDLRQNLADVSAKLAEAGLSKMQ